MDDTIDRDIEHDIDNIMLPIVPNALHFFTSAVIYLMSYEVSSAVKIPEGCLFLGAFGWKVYAKIDDITKRNIQLCGANVHMANKYGITPNVV